MATATSWAGVRMPERRLCRLATYTGWNFRSAAIGGHRNWWRSPARRSRLPGRRRTGPPGDPRPSIEERYTSHDDYLRSVGEAADALVEGRYLLAEDVDPIVARAGAMWDHVVGSR